jgi:NADPH-dependent 2,4-dienoyl-CoA reductase/sulfur reductase-like enzyme
MKRISADLTIIGGGGAGLAASAKAKKLGLEKVVLLDEKFRLGGILLQCIHPGFGLEYLREDLTGPELGEKLAEEVLDLGVNVYTEAYAANFLVRSRFEKRIMAITPVGVLGIRTKAVIFATGAREKHIYETNVVGDRPAGIYTAGEAQTFMDLYGLMPGKEIVIIGSGDVGLIMARRFALQGAKVRAVVERLPYPGGLIRNVVQCLEDFGIPLYLNHTVLKVKGKMRVEHVVVSKVDENFEPIPYTEFVIPCDTVIVATGLMPRIELLEKAGAVIDRFTHGPLVNDWFETTLPGVFAAGNALVINDLVDYAMMQGEWAAESAVHFITNDGLPGFKPIKVEMGNNIKLVVPQLLSSTKDVHLFGRVTKPEKMAMLKIREIDFTKRLLSTSPAEMFKLEIKKDMLAHVDGDHITIEMDRYEEDVRDK